MYPWREGKEIQDTHRPHLRGRRSAKKTKKRRREKRSHTWGKELDRPEHEFTQDGAGK